MKRQEILVKQLQAMNYFDKSDICQLSDAFAVARGTIDLHIAKSIKRKEIIQLKKGLYITAARHEQDKKDPSYIYFLANIIRQPSYVSSWSALQYYDLVTEGIYTITSVTTKVTRQHNNKIGSFFYNSIREELFDGFVLVSGKYDYFIATPAKALFDLLYFKYNQLRGVRYSQISNMVEELRIEFDEMEKKEQKLFYKLIKSYLKKHG